MKTCLRFAQLMAKRCGMSYAEATLRYPRGPYENSVYENGWETHTAHCVHCARAEVLAKR